MRFVLVLLSMFCAAPAMAQMVAECDRTATISSIGETQTFANGAISATILNLGRPAAGENFVFILHPGADGARTCSMVRFNDDRGFASLDASSTPARYDPARGLTVTYDAVSVIPEGAVQNQVTMEITINQATGGIDIVTDVASE